MSDAVKHLAYALGSLARAAAESPRSWLVPAIDEIENALIVELTQPENHDPDEPLELDAEAFLRDYRVPAPDAPAFEQPSEHQMEALRTLFPNQSVRMTSADPWSALKKVAVSRPRGMEDQHESTGSAAEGSEPHVHERKVRLTLPTTGRTPLPDDDEDGA